MEEITIEKVRLIVANKNVQVIQRNEKGGTEFKFKGVCQNVVMIYENYFSLNFKNGRSVTIAAKELGEDFVLGRLAKTSPWIVTIEAMKE